MPHALAADLRGTHHTSPRLRPQDRRRQASTDQRLTIAAGGCTEDCKYCSQSSSYKTETKASRLVAIEPVLEAARKAKANGSTRFCMGAAWRDLAGKKSGFEKILKMVSEVRAMDMEGEWREQWSHRQLDAH